MRQIEEILKSFDQPDEVREYEKMRLEIVRLRGQSFARALYEPGWKWSTHVGGPRGERWCRVEHLYCVIEGSAVAAFEDGRQTQTRQGSLHYIPPVPHDSWVAGNSRYVSLHLLGADQYARK
jgi:hypothetical protein